MSLGLYFLHFFNMGLLLVLLCGLIFLKGKHRWSDRLVVIPFLGITFLALGSILDFAGGLPGIEGTTLFGRDDILHNVIRLGIGKCLGWILLCTGGLSLLRVYYGEKTAAKERQQKREDQLCLWSKEIDTLREEKGKQVGLSKIAVALKRAQPLENLLGESIDTILEVTGVPAGGISLVDEKEGKLFLVEQRGFSSKPFKRLKAVPLGRGLIGKVGLSGTPMLLTAEKGSRKWLQTFKGDSPVHSVAAFPLQARKKTLGVLFLSSEDQGDSFHSHWDFLDTIAHQIGNLVQTHLLQKQVNFQNRRDSVLNLINNTIRANPDPDLVFQMTVHHLGKIMGCDRCQYLQYSEDSRSARISYEYVGEGIQKIIELSLPVEESNLLSAVLSDGLPRSSTRLDREEGMEDLLPFFKLMETRSLLLAPVVFQGIPLGLLALHACSSERRWSQSELESVRAVAEQMAISVKNAQMKQSLQSQEGEALFQREILESIAKGEELESTLQFISKKVSILVPNDTFCIAFYDAKMQRFHIPYFLRRRNGKSSPLKNIVVGGKNTVFSKALSAKGPLYFQSPPIRAYSEKRRCTLWDMGEKTSLCVPITAGEKCLGALYLSRGLQGALSETHLRLLKDLSPTLSLLLQKQLLQSRLDHFSQPAAATSQIHESRDHSFRKSDGQLEKSKLISGVVRDLKPPLNRLSGHTELLLEISRDPRIRNQLDEIRQEAALCQQLLQDFQTFSMDSDQSKKYINLNDLILDILSQKKSAFLKKGIRISTDLMEDLPNTMIGFPVFHRILCHILHVAQEAIRSRGRSGQISVRSELIPPSPAGGFPSPSPEIRLYFLIERKGRTSGSSTEKGNSTHTVREKETGLNLGLLLASNIVKAHGGTIAIRDWRGSFFSIVLTLPAVHSESVSPLDPFVGEKQNLAS